MSSIASPNEKLDQVEVGVVAVARIREGNAFAGMGAARDFSMRPKLYWETRPSPAAPHHWTRSEFLAHLETHRFPPNTIDDRLRVHVDSIRDALVKGQYVPPEVMADDAGKEAVEAAITLIRSNSYAARASAAQQENSQQLKGALFRGPGLSANLREIFFNAAKAPLQAINGSTLYRWPAGGFKEVDIDGYDHPVRVCLLASEGPSWVELCDGRYHPQSIYSCLKSFSMEEVGQIYLEIADELDAEGVTDALSFEEVTTVMGPGCEQYLQRPVVQASYPRD